MDVGTLNAFPLRSDRGDDMGAVQVFATKMSLAKEQLEGLRGNSGIMLKNAHQLAFRPDTIQSGILTLIRSLLGGNSLFQMRLRESEARLIRKEGGLGVAGEGEDFGVAKDDTKNALPPLNVEAKVSAPVKGKSGTPPRSRVG